MSDALGTDALGSGPVRPESGSGFVSPDNDDAGAAALFELEQEAGLPRDLLLHWNLVPWHVVDCIRIRTADDADRIEAEPWLAELLGLLTDLRVIVLCGDDARDGWCEYRGKAP